MAWNDFWPFAICIAQVMFELSAVRFSDFRTRCDFPDPLLLLPVFGLTPSSNHEVGGLGKDWGDGDSKHLLAAKNEKLGGEHDPLRRLLLLFWLFVSPATLEDWFLLGVLILIDFEGVGRCCCCWDPLEFFLLLGLLLKKVRSLEGEFLLFVPISLGNVDSSQFPFVAKGYCKKGRIERTF